MCLGCLGSKATAGPGRKILGVSSTRANHSLSNGTPLRKLLLQGRVSYLRFCMMVSPGELL